MKCQSAGPLAPRRAYAVAVRDGRVAHIGEVEPLKPRPRRVGKENAHRHLGDRHVSLRVPRCGIEGRPAERPFSDSVIPSTLDRTLSPEGTHIMSLFTQWVPHTWAGEPHQAELAAYTDRVVDLYTELAPNFKRSILHQQVIGPYDMDLDYGLVGGNIFHGELSPDQLFHLRPAPGYADFRTPIRGLYQCSSATHGGGGVTGIAGYLASRRILADRRRARVGLRQ